MNELRHLCDKDNNWYATAAVPANYLSGASAVMKVQHPRVPFSINAYSMDTTKGIFIFGLSDEMWTTHVNQLSKAMSKMHMLGDTSYVRDFIEPEDYLLQFAEALSQMKLTATGEATLPSAFGKNIQAVYDSMMAEYNMYFQYEAMAGSPTHPQNSLCKTFLTRYTGTKNGVPHVVLAGMDYKGVEFYSDIQPEMLVGGIAGLVAGMMSRKGQRETGSTQFGHGKPCDMIEWGAENRYLVFAPVQYEAEATDAFVDFVSTFHMEEGLRKHFMERKLQNAEQMFQNTMATKQIAQQNLMNLQMNQARLRQTLAENSAAMSAGIMDSWNKKMASDSRISQARSEAILGVNTYQNSYGQNVSVDVIADHVYENRYGDVYGVSGVAPDQETLNRLDWRELTK